MTDHVLIDEDPPTTLIIRPNKDNPHFPKVPDPEILEKVRASMKARAEAQGKKLDHKAVAARALYETEERALQEARWGCSSRNLDWTEAVAKLRGTVRTVEPNEWGGEDRTFCWVDGACPKPTEADESATRLQVSFRFQAWSHGLLLDHANRYRYCYVTFAVVRGA